MKKVYNLFLGNSRYMYNYQFLFLEFMLSFWRRALVFKIPSVMFRKFYAKNDKIKEETHNY